MGTKTTIRSINLRGDKCTAYARKVVAGKIIAGNNVRASCQRHLDDIKNGSKRGIYFDGKKAKAAYEFFEEILKLNGGQFEGVPFVLHESQCFIIGSLFGWMREDAKRRFRRAYIEMGKGNGKSPLVAGIGLYGMIADNESRAEIYAAASKRDQAMVLFRDARAMVQQSPALKKVCSLSGGDHSPNIAYLRSASFFRPISSDKGQSGPRPHMALCDEVHEHSSRDTMEMLERGFKFREQPMLVMITNSGFDKNSVCWEEHQHAVNVANAVIEDDVTFSYVCSLDDGDDPLNNPSCWAKANPLLGVTITERYLSDIVLQAKAIPGKRNNILRLHFCIWTDSESVWMSRDTWEACEVQNLSEKISEQPCYGGLDLSRKTDLTALARVWKFADGSYEAVVDFWTPAETMRAREDIDRVPYSLWNEQGFLHTTPSKSVDYSHIVPVLKDMDAENEFVAINYDRWSIEYFKRELDLLGVELPLTEIGQGYKDMSPAVELLEEVILNRKLKVKFNPILRWNVASAVLTEDPAGNRKFNKNKATGRIDGVVALAMAMSAANKEDNFNNGFDQFLSNPIYG